MFTISEILNNNLELYIIIYCFIILWVNIDYLRDYKNIKEGLADIPSEEELDINPNSSAVLLLGLIFNFFRSWLIYLLAIYITGNPIVILVSVVLFVVGLYDTLFNYSLAKIKESKIRLYLSVADILFIVSFIVYLFLLR